MSTLKVNTLTDTAATKSVPIADVVNGTARAWVNFNGTGTVAIRASYNVSSITDNGTGDYTVNFTTALADANYSSVGSAMQGLLNANIFYGPFTTAPSTTAFRLLTLNTSFSVTDSLYVSVAIFR